MSVALLLLFVALAYLIICVGALALEMTGLERSQARFQAISAFTGTGFTTRQAENVVNQPRRRKIISYLMILGNAGLVSVLATFIRSLSHDGVLRPSLNLLIIAAAIMAVYRAVTHRRIAPRLNAGLFKAMKRFLHFDQVQVTELLHQADGFGVGLLVAAPGSRAAGRPLADSGLKEQGLLVLSIERDQGMLPVPPPDTVIAAGDRLACYGKLADMHRLVAEGW